MARIGDTFIEFLLIYRIIYFNALSSELFQTYAR